MQIASHVPLENMHQKHLLLSARTARWENISRKTQLLLLPAQAAVPADMLRIHLGAQPQKAANFVPMGSTKTRLLLPPTLAEAVGRACIFPPKLHPVRLAL